MRIKFIEFLKSFNINLGCKLELNKINDFEGLIIEYDGKKLQVSYGQDFLIYRACLIVANKGFDKPYIYEENRPVKNLGIMVDCSRNAVPTIQTIKKLVKTMVSLGYNELLLYLEDVYEMDGEPLFGYLRGRYSKQELKEICAICNEYGITLTPCIQTLAHIKQIKKWPRFASLFDVDDVLLIGDEKVYELIDKMFYSLTTDLNIKKLHVGMDEAYMVGLGQYLRNNGYQDRFEILMKHLKKVSEIASKYSVKIQIWGDMLMRLLNSGTIYADNDILPLDERYKNALPKNVDIIYWDYYSDDPVRYETMIKSYMQFSNDVCFAGGFWKWKGFAPDNVYSMKITKAVIPSILNNGIQEVMFTCWGDDGDETSLFSILPSMAYAALKLLGKDDDQIKSEFNTLVGIKFDDFMLIDELDSLFSNIKERGPINPSKYFLYNDLFLGCYDVFVDETKKENLRNFIKEVKLLVDSDYGYIFKNALALAEVINIKYDLGVRIREAYKQKNIVEIKNIISNIDELIKSINSFYTCFKNQWMIENKPHGFDVQDIRLGGLLKRIEHCKNDLIEYVNGEKEKILELEEELVYNAFGETNINIFYMMSDWTIGVTPNVL
ncbi:MAG: beta-N-acetylhexosaminidase [Bacilli bacterium]|nr:beta-N-acetylhexosaminidase [Bacilli bacterium]